MNSGFAIALWIVGSAAAGNGAQSSCARDVHATATAYRLADLPQQIRDEMAAYPEVFGGGLADSDAPLLQTDAPAAEERDYPTVRFAQAMLVGDKWFVQFEVSLYTGVRTVSFHRHRDGHFRLRPDHFFGGPACASIRAALDGVTAASVF